MCSECGMIPCHPCCPNAPEPQIVLYCCGCGAEIYEGEDYYDIDGTPACEDCVSRMKRTAQTEVYINDEC